MSRRSKPRNKWHQAKLSVKFTKEAIQKKTGNKYMFLPTLSLIAHTLEMCYVGRDSNGYMYCIEESLFDKNFEFTGIVANKRTTQT